MTDRDARDPLQDAFRSLHDEHTGDHPESDATLRQVLLRTRTKQRQRSAVRWFVLPAAAALVCSTAFAAATGKLDALIDALHLGHANPPVASNDAPATSSPPVTPAVPSPSVAPESAPTFDALPASSAKEAPIVPAPRPAASKVHAEPPASASAATTAREAATPDAHAGLYEEAHRAHFVARDPEKALRAWDAYLAATPANARFVPEAHYNRAVSLVRLGRSAEARRELAAFADGAYGDYRRSEAKELLEALARDE